MALAYNKTSYFNQVKILYNKEKKIIPPGKKGKYITEDEIKAK